MVLAVHVCQINYDVFMYKRTPFDLFGLTVSLIEK